MIERLVLLITIGNDCPCKVQRVEDGVGVGANE